MYKNEITPDILCAAEVDKGSCQGDSGEPLVIGGSSSDEDVQVGLVSWGVGCAKPSKSCFVEYRRVPLSQQILLMQLPPF